MSWENQENFSTTSGTHKNSNSVRILCPLKVSIGNIEDEERNVAIVQDPDDNCNVDGRSKTANTSRRGTDSKNFIIIDALEAIEVSCDGGTVRRLCARVRVRIPWIPTLFIAVRPNYIGSLRRFINIAILSDKHDLRSRYNRDSVARKFLKLDNEHDESSSRRKSATAIDIADEGIGVRVNRHSKVRTLIRSRDQILWAERDDMFMYELQFDSFRDRAIAYKFLKNNAFVRSNDYCLFAASDNFAFEIALSAYVREGGRRSTAILDDDELIFETEDSIFSPSLSSSTTTNSGIDLAEIFEMFSWCSIDSSRSNTILKLSDEEIAAIGLMKNPLTSLPVISYDIETIAENMNIVPRGVRRHQKLSSISMTLSLQKMTTYQERSTAAAAATTPTTSVTLMYTPISDSEKLKRYEKQLNQIQQQQPSHEDNDGDSNDNSSYDIIYLYDDEKRLLFDAVEILRNNTFLVQLYRLDDPRDARRLACILLGYNCWEYDYSYLVCRLHFYGLHQIALAIQTFWREPRFCASQISFDLMKHVAARYHAQVGSLALSNVSRYFGAIELSECALSENSRLVKMKFDAVAIRRLYYDTEENIDGVVVEKFDEESAFGNLNSDEGLNVLRIWRYNVQDCLAVYYLAQNLAFFDTVVVYSRHFVVPLVEASYVGNSRLLPNAFAVRALKESRTVLPFRTNVTAPIFLRRSNDGGQCHY